jgi:hypothetical protein
MLIQTIKTRISEEFEADAQAGILDFMEFLDASGFAFERGAGYWKDMFYLLAKHRGEVVYYILLNGSEENAEPKGLTIWCGEDTSNRFAVLHPDDETKETIWKHVDICQNCGGCGNPGGAPKTFFGKEFDGICITPARFDNPDAETLECLKKLTALWLSDNAGHE